MRRIGLRDVVLFGWVKSPHAQQRSAYLDNAKAILIALVVFGHLFSEGMAESRALFSLDMLVYSFHIPAFAFVAGYLSKPDAYTRKGATSVLRLLGGYAFFQAITIAWAVFGEGREFVLKNALLYPEPTLWWFLSLATWRLLLPLFARGSTRKAALVSIAAAIGVAVVGGLLPWPGVTLTLVRTCSFLPFFVGGFRAAQQQWQVPSRWSVLDSVATFLAIYAMHFARISFVKFEQLFQRSSYTELGTTFLDGSLKRLVVLGISAALVVAFMRVVPHTRRLYSHLGSTTLSVYAWHFLTIRILIELGYGTAIAGTLPRALVTIAAILVVFGFGPIAWLTMRVFGAGAMRGTSTSAE